MATTKAFELGQLGSKLTIHNENITLDGNVHGQYAGFDSDFTASIASVNTGSLSEGTNLYYTDARADARAQLKIDALVGSAPGALNTLEELGDALGDDANFSTTVTNSIATKLPLAGGTITGTVVFNSAPTFNTAIAMGSSLNVATDIGIAGTSVIDSNRRILAADGAENVPYITFAADTNTGLYRPGTDTLGFSTAGSERMRITSSGSVAIGSLYNGSSGSMEVSIGSTSLSGGVTLWSPTNSEGGINFGDGYSGTDRYRGSIAYNHSSDHLKFLTASTERMRIDSSGNVGIGYTSPNEKLHVNGHIEASAGYKLAGHPVLDYNNFDGGYSTRLGSTGTSTLNATQIFAGGSVQATFKGGKVGIGTTSPAELLHLKKSSGAPVLRLEAPASELTRIELGDGSNYTHISSRPDMGDGLMFYENGAVNTVMRGGKVGIDDNNPSEKLSIGGGSIRIQDVGQYIYFGTNSSVKIGTASGNSNDLYLGSADDLNMESNFIRFWRDGYYGSTEYSRLAYSDYSWLCNGSGSHKLGIGITNPSEKLHVSGNILATGNITANSDISLKDNITPIPNALDKVLQIRGVTFNRNDIEDNPRHAGVIAQEVEKVLPEVVSEGEDGIKSVAYGNMVSLLIEAIKEQQEQIDKLKEKLESK